MLMSLNTCGSQGQPKLLWNMFFMVCYLNGPNCFGDKEQKEVCKMIWWILLDIRGLSFIWMLNEIKNVPEMDDLI